MANNPNTFLLSRNRSKFVGATMELAPKANPKWPDYRGEATIEGKTYEIAGWIRTRTNGGGKFISGNLTVKVVKVAETPAEGPGPSQFDDDPPFAP